MRRSVIALANFATESFGDFWLTSWSNDGRFALVGEYNSDEQQILSLPSKILNPLPSIPMRITLTWHPTDGTLAYLTKEGSTLITMDAEYGSFQEKKLPSAFRDLVWSPTGTYIALTAADNSLWKIDYQKLENLEQLTPSFPSYADHISWSPDSTYLSFISGSDIYIVETVK